jgi:serine/threonine-protein phosphatase PP1 catalytic subunit
MDWEGLCGKVEKIFESEPRLIRLPSLGKAVFVGDSHGDFDATEKVLYRYLKKPYRVVFLGDYVDRGIQSEENLQFLLTAKLKHPEEIYLLAGNHEGFMTKRFLPANFWEDLAVREREILGRLFSKFPLAATTQNGILGVHGGLPDLGSLEEIDQIEWGDENWTRITWGDFLESEAEILGDWGGRPQFGGQYFRRMMERYQRKLLIRSHQPNSPQWMFDKSCITIFTSYAYKSTRTIVVVDLEKELGNFKEVVVETI